MSMISIYLPYFLYSVPFVVAAIILVKARLDARRAANAPDYERFVWSDETDEQAITPNVLNRRYVSYTV